MASDDRNFRYGYYEKVGFGGIEEKRSLEILLREKPPDLLSRLSQLTSRFSVSANQRKQIWQLLLDVTDPENRITEMRLEIQREIVRDIINALVLMHWVDVSAVSTTKVDYSLNGHPRLILLIYLFESKQLNFDLNQQKAEMMDLLTISEVLCREFLQSNTQYNLEDNYWIYKNFISLIKANLGPLVETYEKFIQHLLNDDKTLHQHLVKNGILCQSTSQSRFLPLNHITNCSNSMNLKSKIGIHRPIITWFTRLFAGIIHQNFLIRVFDKVIGCLVHGIRPFYVLLSLSKALMASLRESLLKLNSADELTKLMLMPLSIELSEKIVLKALTN